MLRFGIIGFGEWAQNYENTIGEFPEIQSVRMFKELSAQEFYAAPPTANVVLAKIKSFKLDGVIIACSPSFQEGVAPTLIDNNIPLILEKPLATKRDVATEIIDSFLNASNPTVFVNHFHLFEPSFLRFCNTTDVKELSKILIADYGDGPFRRALEPLFDWGSHAVGIILKITNKPPLLYRLQRKQVLRMDGRAAEKITVHLKFENGFVSRLDFGNGYRSRKRSISIIKRNNGSQENWFLKKAKRIKDGYRGQPMGLLIEEFALTILQNKPPQNESFKIGALSALFLIEMAEGSSTCVGVERSLSSKFLEAFQRL